MSDSDVAEITKIFVDVLPSMVRNRDVVGYVNLYTVDGIWCPPNAPDRRGPEEIARGFEGIIANQNIDAVFFVDQAEVMGDLGYVFGRSTEVLRPLDGSDATVAYSRELWHFRKVGTEWKISKLIFNLKPDPHE